VLKGRISEFLLSLITIGMMLAGCSQSKDAQSADSSGRLDSLATGQPEDSIVIWLVGTDSATAFHLLLQSHRVDYSATAGGVFVRGIDTVSNSSDFFWIYSVNDSVPQVACDRYHVSDGDTVRWHYRRVWP
jgi:hypothetical protein